MSKLPLIIVCALALAFLSLLVYRIMSGRKYSVLLGLVSIVFFGALYNVFEQVNIQPVADSKWFSNDYLQQAAGVLFCLSIAYFINGLIKKYVYPRRLTLEGDSKVPLLIQYLVTLLIYLVALIFIVGVVFGQSVTGLVTASGAVVLVLGYSARSMVDEVVAGISININAPFEKGDLIQINEEWGYVKDVDWRSITYVDMNSNYVVVPNSKVAASTIRNLDRPTQMTRRTTCIRVEYNVPPQVVVDECNAAMSECPKIEPHPWNFCSFYECDEKGIRYKLHFHVKHYDDWYVASDQLLNAIWYRFARKGIRFAHQRKLNYTSSENERRVLANSAYDDSTWNMLVERFQQVPMFEGMTPEDMHELARSAKLHIVGPPEWIIKAGSEHHSMFLIASGAADVYEVDRRGNETLMATMGESETLGLMSLLLGIPQKTTVRAKEECAVWEISSESLHALFDRKPEVMESIASNVARWQDEEAAALQAIQRSRAQERKAIQQRANRLNRGITRFFQRQIKEENNEEYMDY